MPTSRRLTSQPVILNRLYPIMLHIDWYTVAGTSRLAADCGVASSTIGRLQRNRISPSYALALAVSNALSKRMGVPIDMRDIFAPRTDFRFPTACVCDLSPSCRGCFPPEAYDEEDRLRFEYENLRPGDWCYYLPHQTPPPTSSLIQPQ